MQIEMARIVSMTGVAKLYKIMKICMLMIKYEIYNASSINIDENEGENKCSEYSISAIPAP
jgi:hypothetical protein